MFRMICVLLTLTFASTATAQRAPQGLFWVQVRAVPTATQALDVARQLDNQFENVVGFEIGGGWHALALGPYDRPTADRERLRLLNSQLVPSDSFVANGTSYRNQYWPPDLTLPIPNIAYVPPASRIPATPARAATQAPQALEVVPVSPASDETLAQARASEALLSRDDKKLLQQALTWAGVYGSAIDGLYGRGTRSAMRLWQDQQGLEPTGVLTTAQRAALLAAYNSVFDGLGLEQTAHADAGISIEVPMNMVNAPTIDAPFIQYTAKDGSGISLILISQEGDRNRMRALYEVMQTLKILPEDGDRSVNNRGFQITGIDATRHSEAFVQLQGTMIKGAMLVWPAGDDDRRRRVRDRIFASFATTAGALPDAYFLETGETPPDALAGLDIRKPIFTRTGTMLDNRGHILTAAAGLGECGRVDLLDGTTLTPIDAIGSVALYRSRTAVAPVTAPVFQTAPPRLPQNIVVGGFSYGGLLGSPTITTGRIEDSKDLDGNTTISRLNVASLDGDIGAPVMDRGGAIMAILLPQPEGRGRTLPPDTQFAQQWQTIAPLLDRHGIRPQTTDVSADMHPEDLTAVVEDFTVTVRCWD